MWALSKLAVESRDSALLDAVAAAMLPALPEFNAQNIANTVRPRVSGPGFPWLRRWGCAAGAARV